MGEEQKINEMIQVSVLSKTPEEFLERNQIVADHGIMSRFLPKEFL